jgi:hypothetical protein
VKVTKIEIGARKYENKPKFNAINEPLQIIENAQVA